ncbi:hypothetical protein Elgi_38800 [Paenibacillus elgii]|uniref:hypothetical protein n=1 Tax=Paenibacillus elgii TaxID=189691 RepID=UPI002D7BA1B9|nr:hypothetical protein Elgi_38800 [Paenibacillus elgii]
MRELGVAQGISFVYSLFNTYKNRNFTSEQWMEVIKNSASQDEKIGEYFARIINSEKKETNKNPDLSRLMECNNRIRTCLN